jgi:2-polyprenyl-3-methyl-5-hydroxy-6-metoxy-1,4-benzoquinol methylase
MHPFLFNQDLLVGRFKNLLQETTWHKDHPDFPRALGYFEAYMAARPFYMLDYALDKLGTDRSSASAIDIASATGRFSFALAERGLGRVVGVEIRPEQVAQAQLVQDTVGGYENLRFEHEPMSADDPAFRAGEVYDLVLSLGLLYHLANPLQHLLNLGRMTRKIAVIKTLIHREAPRTWKLVQEDPTFITKATSGVSWIAHYMEVERWLKAAGFKRVESLVPPTLENIADAFRLQAQSTPARYVDNWLRMAGVKPSLEKISQSPVVLEGGHSPYYFTYVAYK